MKQIQHVTVTIISYGRPLAIGEVRIEGTWDDVDKWVEEKYGNEAIYSVEIWTENVKENTNNA